MGGTDIRVAGDSVPIELHVTTPQAHIAWPDEIGFDGKFMGVNGQPGTEMILHFKVTAPGEATPKSLPKAYFTFFDFDTHEKGNAEYVCVDHFAKAFTTKTTELQKSEETKDGALETCFTASTVGNGHDNPTDPLSLTKQQLDRAVTFEFDDFTELIAVVGSKGAEGQTHGRKFNFIGRPSVLCAEGTDKDNILILQGEDSVGSEPQCCILKASTLAIACAKKEEAAFYQRMCDAFARRLDVGYALTIVAFLLLTTVAE